MKTDDMTEVRSSALSHIHHDPETQTCTVRFHSGKQHTYSPMTVEEFAALSNAPSVGWHFSQNVRNNQKYSTAQVEEREPVA